MRGRPLCVAAAAWICCILVLWLFGIWDGSSGCLDLKKWDGTFTVNCQVEEIQGRGEKQSLVVRDVVLCGDRRHFDGNGSDAVCDRMKVYAGYSKKGGNSGSGGENLFGNVKIGQIISMEGTPKPFDTPGNPGQFNEQKYYKELGIDCKFFAKSLAVKRDTVDRLAQWLFEMRQSWCGILEKCLPEKDAGIMAAMVLGEKSGLSTEVKDLYKENGIAHILAISGLHISMIGMGLFYLLRRFVMPMRAAAGVTAACLFLYGILTGFSVATSRAVFMMFCMLGARFLGKRYDGFSALALSALISLVFRPALLFQSGFQLSYGTVLGILLFLKPFGTVRTKGGRLWGAVSGSLGISFVTLPVLLFSYYEWNLYSAAVNSLVLPLVGALVVVAAAGSAVAVFWLPGGQFLMGTVHYVLKYYEAVCNFTENLPLHRMIPGCPEWWRILLYYLLLGLFCLLAGRSSLHGRDYLHGRNSLPYGGGKAVSARKLRIAGISVLFLALAVLLFPKSGPDGMVITNLDVGQGDCACIQCDGKVFLIDGGSSSASEVGKYRIAAFLKYNGISRIDYIFVSHADSDHVNGIEELLAADGHMGFEIGKVVLPAAGKTDEKYEEFARKSRSHGVEVTEMAAGDFISTGGTRVRCIHPASDYHWQSENDYSLTLAVERDGFCALFTGDLEQSGEMASLEKMPENVDYLKVGHHGSKGSSGEEFLRKVKPRIAVISVGESNLYGHPHEELLGRLRQAGSRVLRTDEHGAVFLEIRGGREMVGQFCP